MFVLRFCDDMRKEQEISDIRQNGGVELMKASAGSGKTFSLAREYLRLLLLGRDKEHCYRHILAVTFTNKATEEMKSRIVEELDTLAKYPGHSPYLSYLMDECHFGSEEELRKAAAKSLSEILSDYGAFSVSTIDKFFQRVLRSFAREVGQFGQYQVELDRKALVQESADRVLDSLSKEKPELLDWLTASAIEDISEGGKYTLTKTLYDFAEKYMSEDYRQKADAIGMNKEKAFSEANLNAIRELCRKEISSFESKLKKLAESALQAASAEIKPVKNLVARLAKLALLDAKEMAKISDSPTKYWLKAVDTYDDCKKIDELIQSSYPSYRTAQILRGQVAVFRAAEELDKRFKELLKEKNVLGIEDTNDILRDIIGGSDAPFVYEKVGVRYEHFLLDEFQDTSSVQWDNFRPLLQNSIAEGCYNLIVGDVKQSIYRWRNARWEIIDREVDRDLRNVVHHSLVDNWRSAPEIVSFNNDFFSCLAKALNSGYAFPDFSISKIYEDVRQNAKKSSVPGSVQISFCDNDAVYDEVVESVRDALSRGFSQKDIAVIVRTNKIGQQAASALTEAGFGVITNDSLRIGACESIRRLLSCLYKVDNPDDAVNAYLAGDFEPASVADCQSLSDMCDEILQGLPSDMVDKDSLYVLSFMDLVRDFAAQNGNSLHAFLKYWTEEGSNKYISSPDDADAVTIITVHKVKGLDYPYVIIPLQKREYWIRPDVDFWVPGNMSGTGFESVEKALYATHLNKTSINTCFGDDYKHELPLAITDNVNTWYVAMTRASEAMHVIAPWSYPNEVESHGAGEPWFGKDESLVKGLASALRLYCLDHVDVAQKTTKMDGDKCPTEHFLFGSVSDKFKKSSSGWSKPSVPVESIELSYSGGMPSNVAERRRVGVKNDAFEFFSDGETGMAASARLRGIVLHKVMETVYGPEDLELSLQSVQRDGLLDASELPEARKILSEALAFGVSQGWFPGDRCRILDERDIIASDGSLLRPDRVILRKDGGVDIVDYKFGTPKKSYLRQVRRYVALYKELGYSDVSGYLWYVLDGAVESV